MIGTRICLFNLSNGIIAFLRTCERWFLLVERRSHNICNLLIYTWFIMIFSNLRIVLLILNQTMPLTSIQTHGRETTVLFTLDAFNHTLGRAIRMLGLRSHAKMRVCLIAIMVGNISSIQSTSSLTKMFITGYIIELLL